MDLFFRFVGVCEFFCSLTKTLAHPRDFVNKHFSTDDVSERAKGGKQISILELLREMVDKQVGSIRT